MFGGKLGTSEGGGGEASTPQIPKVKPCELKSSCQDLAFHKGFELVLSRGLRATLNVKA